MGPGNPSSLASPLDKSENEVSGICLNTALVPQKPLFLDLLKQVKLVFALSSGGTASKAGYLCS